MRAMCCDSVVIMGCICRGSGRTDNTESEMEILYCSSGEREPQFTVIMITLRDGDSRVMNTQASGNPLYLRLFCFNRTNSQSTATIRLFSVFVLAFLSLCVFVLECFSLVNTTDDIFQF